MLTVFVIIQLSEYALPQDSDWRLFTSMYRILDIADDGDYIWVAVFKGGLIKIDRITGEKTTYHMENSGLPHNEVEAVEIDKDGNVWIGMRKVDYSEQLGGLVKFDGENWVTYDVNNSLLPGNDVFDLAIDTSGAVWIGTYHGLAKFYGDNWTVYNISNSPLTDNRIRALAVDYQGNVWIGIRGSLVKYDGVDWTIYPLTYIEVIVPDSLGNVWVGTSGLYADDNPGLVKFDGKNWTVYDTSNSDIPDKSVYGLDIDDQGNIWLGTYVRKNVYQPSGSLAKFDGENWTVYRPENSELPDGGIRAIHVGSHGDILVGMAYQGLLSLKGENWKFYKPDLPYRNVSAIACDSKGNGWIGTEIGFLAKFDGEEWTTCNTWNSEMPHNSIKVIEVDSDDDVWVVSLLGDLVKIQADNWTVARNRAVIDIAIDNDDNIWAITGEGLEKFDGENWTVYDTKDRLLERLECECIAINDDGTKWIGTLRRGLIKLDGEDYFLYNKYNSGLPADRIAALEVDARGNLWIIVRPGAILVKFDGTDWTVCDDRNSLPGTGISAVTADIDGNLWISSYHNRIESFDGIEWTEYSFSHLFDDNSNVGNCIACDTYGNIWIGTRDGLVVYREGGVILSNIEYGHGGGEIPSSFRLYQNYPNPFNPITNISYSVSERSHIILSIFNVRGHKVRTLVDGIKNVGYYTVRWNAPDEQWGSITSGVYFLRLKAGENIETKKMLFLK